MKQPIDEIDPRRKYWCSCCNRYKIGKHFAHSPEFCNLCLDKYGARKCITCGNPYASSDKRRLWCSPSCAPGSAQGRFIILERDDFQCIYCGKSSIEDRAELHVDHIVPKSKGGPDRSSNLVTTCKRCNLEKTNRLMPEHLIQRVLDEVARRNESAGLFNELIKLPGSRQ